MRCLVSECRRGGEADVVDGLQEDAVGRVHIDQVATAVVVVAGGGAGDGAGIEAGCGRVSELLDVLHDVARPR